MSHRLDAKNASKRDVLPLVEPHRLRFANITMGLVTLFKSHECFFEVDGDEYNLIG